MQTTFRLCVTAALLSTGIAAFCADQPGQKRKRTSRANVPPSKTAVYKTVGDTQLKVNIFLPAGHQATDRRAAIVFFFGGGWRGGSPTQFSQHCRYLASRGMVAMAADYRVYSRQKARVADCVADAKSAIRWVRQNAPRLGIDPNRIASGGGSAGGHLAAAVGTLDEFDEPSEDRAISSRPNAMVLFNPALELTAKAFSVDFQSSRYQGIAKRMGAAPERLSPTLHIKKETPPAIIFHGKADTTVPFNQSEQFAAKMKQLGNRCELAGYDGQTHGFFNYGRGNNEAFRSTLKRADAFLVSVGFLEGSDTVDAMFPPPGGTDR